MKQSHFDVWDNSNKSVKRLLYGGKHTYLTAGMRNTCEQADAKIYKTLQTDLKPLGRWNT